MQAKKKASLSDAHIGEVAHLFGVLSEPSRLRLLRALMVRPLTVSELMVETGMKQGNVSKHLGALLMARFVAREREGNFVRYELADKRLHQLCDLMCQRIEDEALARASELGAGRR